MNKLWLLLLFSTFSFGATADKPLQNTNPGGDIPVIVKNSAGTSVEVGRFSPPLGDAARSIGTVGSAGSSSIFGALVAGAFPGATNLTSFFFLDTDDGATITDDSGNANNLTKTNVVFGSTGFFDRNSIAYFNGTSSYLTSTAAFYNVGTGTSWTVGGWFKHSDWNASNQNLFAQAATTSDRKFELVLNNTQLIFEATNTAGAWDTSFTVNHRFTPGTWHHVVMEFDFANTKLRAFIDGMQVTAGSTLANTRAGTANFKVGARYAGEQFFQGQAQDIFFTQQALTDLQINQIYSRRYNNAQIAAGHVLVAESFPRSSLTSNTYFYNLNGSPSDGSGNGKTLTGGTSNFSTININGASSAYVCDGSTTDANILKLTDTAFDIASTNPQLSAGAWFKLPDWDGTTFHQLMGHGDDSGSNQSFAIWKDNAANFLRLYGGGGGGAVYTQVPVSFVPFSWHHLAVTISIANVVKGYVDGIFVGSATSVTPQTVTNKMLHFCARHTSGTSYDLAVVSGTAIEQAFMTKYEMTAQDIYKIYSAKLNHNKNIALSSGQSWEVMYRREEADNFSFLPSLGWLSAMNPNNLFVNFGDLNPGDKVLIRSK